MDFKKYIQEIKKYPRLNNFEYFKDTKKYKQEIIYSHLYLVAEIIENYKFNEDLFQEGVLGLIRATEKFNNQSGITFEYYAQWWIKSYINKAYKYKSKCVHLPRYLFNIIKQLKKYNINPDKYTPQSIALKLKIPLSHAKKALIYIYEYPVILNYLFNKESIFYNQGKRIEKTIINKELLKQILEDNKEIIKRDLEIIKLCFGISPYQETEIPIIADKYNLAVSTIYSIKYRILQKLKKRYDRI